MKIKFISTLAVLSAVGLAAPAFADGQHFIKHDTFAVLDGPSLVCYFKEAGLPSGQLETVECDATESITYECVNGGGKNPSADNKHTFKTEGSASGVFPADQNGNINGHLTIDPETAGALGFSCPSGQDVTFVSVTYSNISIVDETSGAFLNITGSFTYSDPSAPPVR